MSVHRSRVTLAAAGVLLSLAGGLTCTDLSGPKGGLTSVGVAPAFTREAEGAYQRLARLAVALDNIRLRLKRGDGTSAVDTVVVIRAGAESVTIELDVRVNGAEEQFNAVIDLRAGDLVLFSGTQVVIAKTTGTSPPVPPIEVEYVGPGASAVDVKVLPAEIAILSNQTAVFTAVAFDANEQPLADLLVDWTVRDPAIGGVSAEGLFTPVAGIRGSTWVIATLPTDVKDSARVTVSPVPTTAVLVSGGGQSGPVGQALSPFVFEVRAVDELPVPGVAVSFNVASGSGELSATTGTTDGVGRVSVTLTLGTQPGENAVQLLVGEQAFATASAIGSVGLPAVLALEGGSPISVQAGQAIAVHAVRVFDAFENPVPNVQVNLALTPRGSPEVLLQTTATSDQEGRVLLSSLGATQNAGLFDIHATVVEPTGITPIVVPLEVVAGSGSVLAFTTQPPRTLAGAPFTFAVSVRDAQGNVATGFTGPVTIALANNPTEATLGGTLTRNAVAGVATFDDLAITAAASGYTLSAAAEGLTSVTSVAFNVDPAAVAALAFIAQPSTVATGGQFTVGVAARDAFSNVVTGFTGAVTIAFGNNPTQAVLSGTLTQNAVAGVATFSDLAINVGGTGYTLVATSGALNGTSAPIDVAALSISTADGGHRLINAAGSQTFVVVVTDDQQAPFAGAPVQFSLESGPCALISPTSVSTDASGQATIDANIAGVTASCVIRASLANQGPEPPQTFHTLYLAPAGVAVWTGRADGDLGISANWLPDIPTATATVFIPRSAAFASWPAVNGGIRPQYASLIIEGGALFNITNDTLTLADSLAADGIVNGASAMVRVTGAGASGIPTVRGNVQAKLVIGLSDGRGTCLGATYRVGGALIADSLQMDCNLDLDTPADVTVRGAMRITPFATFTQTAGIVTAGGRIEVQGANGSLRVTGGVLNAKTQVEVAAGAVLEQTGGTFNIDGQATFLGDQRLWSGTLQIGGTLTHVSNGDSLRIDGRIEHLTRFVGDATTARLIDWTWPTGGLLSQFGQLEFSTTGDGGMSMTNAQGRTEMHAIDVAIRSQARFTIPTGGGYVLATGGLTGRGITVDVGGQLSNLGTLSVAGRVIALDCLSFAGTLVAPTDVPVSCFSP